MHGMNTLLDKKCGEYPFKDKGLPIIYCPTCQAEIAILEQAIAEIKSKDANSWYFICTKCNKESITDIRGKEKYLCYECALQKQRQEILEWINYLERQIISSGEKVYTEWLRQELSIKKQQLNQLKEEQ
jgi:hypothetical protein